MFFFPLVLPKGKEMTEDYSPFPNPECETGKGESIKRSELIRKSLLFWTSHELWFIHKPRFKKPHLGKLSMPGLPLTCFGNVFKSMFAAFLLLDLSGEQLTMNFDNRSILD